MTVASFLILTLIVFVVWFSLCLVKLEFEGTSKALAYSIWHTAGLFSVFAHHCVGDVNTTA